MRFKQISVAALAQALGGQVVGDGARIIRGMNTIEAAGPGELTFLSNMRYAKLLAGTKAEAVLVAPEVQAAGRTLILVPQPYLAFAHALALLAEVPPPQPGIHAGAHIHAAARLAPDVTVMPGAYVGAGARIGPGCLLYPGAVVLDEAVLGAGCILHAGAIVRERCVLGARVILNANATIGGDGYGFAQDGARHVKIPQVGTVELGDDVEVGAGSTIDRAALGATVIGRGTKIDNLVQIGHGCRVGEDVLIVAQSGLAGSTTIGDRATLAARTGVLGHLTLGAGTLVYSLALVTRSTPPGAVVSGNPARPHREQLRREAAPGRNERHIEALARRIEALEAELAALKDHRRAQAQAQDD